MNNRYDFLVIGAGAAGSSVAYELSKQLGTSGFDSQVHALLSSHAKNPLPVPALGGDRRTPIQAVRLRRLARQADVLGAAFNLLMMAGCVCGGWQMARAALAASAQLAAGGDPKFYGAKLVTARFYAEQLLPRAGALLTVAKAGAASMMALDPEQF